MKKPKSVNALEELGRIRLSPSFFMRDFLYSEIANFYGIQNIPDDADLAIEVGKHLCEELLEPLNATFGRIAIRSAYRSCAVNQKGNEEDVNCAANEKSYAGHIWDRRDDDGLKGATACVVVPWFADQYREKQQDDSADTGSPPDADWRALAYWIHDHLPYSELQFFPRLAAFNISWHERPKRSIASYVEPKGYLLCDTKGHSGFAQMYQSFPPFRRG
jgi:hypothetical protein